MADLWMTDIKYTICSLLKPLEQKKNNARDAQWFIQLFCQGLHGTVFFLQSNVIIL